MRTRYRLIGLASAAAMLSAPARAHHSFAAHFLPDPAVTITGVVTEYRFRNPHGLIFVEAENDDGTTEQWRIETNAPSVLRRRGWSETSLSAGDAVTIIGYPARDGSNSARVYRVTFADGRELLGQSPSADQE